MTMDKIGRAILAHLSRDARISWQELGRQVHLTGQAVATRVQQMQDSGTIRRFTVVRGDLHRYFVTVFMDSNRFAEFEAFLQACEQVETASKVAGEGCYHLVLACADASSLETFTTDLLRYGRYKVSSEMRRVKD